MVARKWSIRPLCIVVELQNISHLGHQVTFPAFVSDFDQIWSVWTDFNNSVQYRISRKSVELEPRWYMRKDRRTDMTEVIGSFLRLNGNAPRTVWMLCHLWSYLFITRPYGMTIYTELREFGRPWVQVSALKPAILTFFVPFLISSGRIFFEHVCVLMSSRARCLLT